MKLKYMYVSLSKRISHRVTHCVYSRYPDFGMVHIVPAKAMESFTRDMSMLSPNF
jgi:hypothetical protein